MFVRVFGRSGSQIAGGNRFAIWPSRQTRARPYRIVSYIPFGCRGWRPRHPDVVLPNKMYFKPCRGAPVWAPVRCSINCAVNRIILIFHTKSLKFLQYFQKRSCQNIKVVIYLKLPNKTLQFNIGDFLLSYGYIVLFLYSFIRLYAALCSQFRIVKNAISNQIDCLNA